jgi:hypothetical protein
LANSQLSFLWPLGIILVPFVYGLALLGAREDPALSA